MSSKAEEPSVINIGTNGLLPFSSGPLLLGSSEFVANEVLVSWLVRRFMGMERSLFKLARIHTLSLPFLGGAAGFMDPAVGLDDKSWTKQMMAGGKGIPAVLLAHYIDEVFHRGFVFPSGGMKEYLVTMVAKIISRPVLSTVAAYLPGSGIEGLYFLHSLVTRQAANSNFASAKSN